MNKNTSIRLRMLTALGLLALMIYWVGPQTILGAVTGFKPGYYLAALTLLLVHMFLQGVVIRLLLASRAIVIRIGEVFRLMAIANFFGIFLPGAVGPDMVLCYNLVKSTDKKETALGSVIFIRVAVLFIMALLAFIASFHPAVSRPGIHLITGGVLLAFAAYFFIMANRNTLALAGRLLEVLNRHRITAMLYKTYFAVSDITRDHRAAMRVAPLLLASAAIKIVTDYFIALALGIEIPLLLFFVFIPIITIVSAVPVTFAGLGVREGSYAGLFALAGIPVEQSIAVSLASFSLVIALALIGAFFYLIWGSSLAVKNPEDAHRDQGPVAPGVDTGPANRG